MSDNKKIASKYLTLDGWKNILTGLGMMGRDKRMGADVEFQRMDQRTAETLYACDDMAAKIVNTLPEEMIREGFIIKHDGKDYPTLNADIMNVLDDIGAIARIEEGLKWGRMYGGAGSLIGIDDGRDASEPVDLGSIKRVEFLNNMNRWELHPLSIQQDPTYKNFGMPEEYRLQPAMGGATLLHVHHSRILRWNGAGLPRRLQIENNYWDDSVLNRVYNVIRNFQTSHDSVANLLQDFAQAVYKIKNLTEMIAMGKDDLVEKRLALVDRTRSIVNAIVLEEGEDFDRKVTSLTGLPETIKMVNQRLVQASGLPHTILLGESPSGLGATGNSEKSDWYDYVARQQETQLIPQLTQLVKLILLSKDGPTKGVEPKNWRIEALPLQQQTLKEKLETRKLQSEIDKNYIDSSVISPVEVAKNRFAGDEFNYETKLDLETDLVEEPEEEEEEEETKPPVKEG
jgi:phage-related protein (TIGR01555 family)